MDVRQLKFFLAVVDYGGFSKAADQLMVAQPSLSQAIAAFERELGAPLFHRIGRGVVLSDAGGRWSGRPEWCCAISTRPKPRCGH